MSDLFRAATALASQSSQPEPELTSIFPKTPLYFLRTGRECLYVILKALGLAPGSSVGIPLYCCMSLFQAIAAAGHAPVFLDIDPNDYSLDEEFLRKNKSKLDALVIVHTFGYPVNIRRIRLALGGRNIPIIEDCAHALMSTYDGQPAGSFGDASFFSFAMHKPAPVGGGAALLVNNPDLASAASQEFDRVERESLIGEIRQSFVCALRGMAYQRPVYSLLMASPLRHWRNRAPRLPSAEELHSIRHPWSPKAMRRVDRALLSNRIRAFQKGLPALARNTQEIRNRLNDVPLHVPAEPCYGTWNHFALPIRYLSADARDRARAFLITRSIDTAPMFQHCAENARWFGYEGGCLHAEAAAKTLCCVPNYSRLSDEDVSYIGSCLRLTAETQEIHTSATLQWHKACETDDHPGARII
jgi:perosamine synthetase